ncbi:MAG: multiheme c-type cytochrome [Proteobacteria bacterium]|jgi:hypothetical protein|nr:multiheme c-type cytochrome [Pseudomonadota bacterium]
MVERRAGRLHVDAVGEWRSPLSGSVGALLLFTGVSGLLIYLLPFSIFSQLSVLMHTIIGVLMLPLVVWFVIRHWLRRRRGNFSHYQLLGYLSLAVLSICIASGLVLSWQGVFETRINYSWDTAHLITGLALIVFLLIHLLTVVIRKTTGAQQEVRAAQRRYGGFSVAGTVALVMLTGLWTLPLDSGSGYRSFAPDYNWSFGEDRPFAPSLSRLDYSALSTEMAGNVGKLLAPDQARQFEQSYARQQDPTTGLTQRVQLSLGSLGPGPGVLQEIEAILEQSVDWIRQQGAIEPAALAGSQSCGVSGCHQQIYEEWLPSAHRYSSMDDMFQKVQVMMAAETSPEHTRFCAGCHDPISLFAGAKNAGNITLSADGSNEGISCLACHSIVQADVQGNGDYTVGLPERYLFEAEQSGLTQLASHFLMRTYPEQHIASLARPLYKTEEMCAACHKQYMDKEVNTDIGKVQGQNQYDSWKNSRWYHEGDPERTIGCRECHMPLQDGNDPARGDATDYNRTPDDEQHRSHRFLASNQYIPTLQNLEGAALHVELTEKWLRGEIEIPEIADKWTEGPVVRLDILAPETIKPDEELSLRVVLTNNKTGHDFPTGPLDMIESWIEIKVTDEAGQVIYHTGAVNEDGTVADSQVVFRSDGFDRQGKLIDRHNLWDLVGASYKRSMYPGVTDAVEVRFRCPSMSRPRVVGDDGEGKRTATFAMPAAGSTLASQLKVTATLWYRKANPEFLDRVYGASENIRSPATAMSTASTSIDVLADASE